MTRPYQGAYSRRFSNFSTAGGNTTYSVNVYSNMPEMGSVTYTIESSVNTGRVPVDDTKGGSGLPAGTVIRVKAVPKSGYKFVSWRGDVPGGMTQSSAFTVTVTKDIILYANFERQNYPTKTANIQWNGAMGRVSGSSSNFTLGSGTPANSATVTAVQGSSVTLTATPLDGYHFVKWSGGPSSISGHTEPTRTFQLNEAYTINAIFAADNPNPGSHADEPGVVVGGETPVGGQDPENPEPNTNGGGATGGITMQTVTAFVKKWWWALAIVAYVVYKEWKGGRK